MSIEELIIENKKLKAALIWIMPWAGEPAEGPNWATPEVKAKNLETFWRAVDAANACITDEDMAEVYNA